MRLSHLGSALAIVALVVPAVITAGTRNSPVHEERRQLSPAARQALVLEDLHSILKGPASLTSIATKPYPSSEFGLCRRDVIQLSYTVSDPGEPREYTPKGVDYALPQYHYLGLPQSRGLADWRKACNRLTGVDEYWASSGEDDHYVSFALASLEQAIIDVRTGAGVTLRCEEEGTACAAGAAEFLQAAPNVSKVWRCEDRSLGCFEYEMAEWIVTIVVEYHNNTSHTTIKLAPEPIILS